MNISKIFKFIKISFINFNILKYIHILQNFIKNLKHTIYNPQPFLKIKFQKKIKKFASTAPFLKIIHEQ